MAIVITKNIWRFFKPGAPKITYGVIPGTYVYVDLTQELMQGNWDADPTSKLYMGYLCNYVVDFEPQYGNIIYREDGRGFFYQPNKDFTGTDYLSYRIINSMGQTSEPECIYFKVDGTIKRNGKIIEKIVKLQPVILQNGNSDMFYEKITTMNDEIDRVIYAFNTIPNSKYLLVISTNWKAYIQRYSKYTRYTRYGYWEYYDYFTYSESKNTVFLTVETNESDEFLVIDFKTPLSLNLIGLVSLDKSDVFNYIRNKGYYLDSIIYYPEDSAVSLSIFTITDYTYNIYFTLIPIGSAKTYSKNSNDLPLILYDPQYYIDNGLPFPEDNPSVSPDLAKLIDKSNVKVEIINTEQKNKLLMLINGKDIVATTIPTNIPKNLDLTGLTYSDSTSTIQLTNVSYVNPNKITEYNRTEVYDTDNNLSATISTLVFNISDIPNNETFALVAQVSASFAVLKNRGITFIKKDTDGNFVESETYTGLCIIQKFNPVGYVDKDNPTLEVEYRADFSSNMEYLINNNNPNLIPIDFKKIVGFFAVPLKVEGKESKSTMSNVVPIAANATTGYLYKDIASSLYQAIYLGDSANAILPPLFTAPEMTTYQKPTVQVANLILIILRNNNYDFKVNWRIVDITDFDDSTTDLYTFINTHPEKVMKTNVIQDYTGCSLLLEYSYGTAEHTSKDFPEKYPEIITIHLNKTYDQTLPPGISKLALIADYDKNTSTLDAKDVILKIYDCEKNSVLAIRSVDFTAPNKQQHLLYGFLTWDSSFNPSFEEKLQLLEPPPTTTTTEPPPTTTEPPPI